MSQTYLITRPEHDDATHFLSNWGKSTISLAQEKNYKTIDLHRERATHAEVESVIKKIRPDLIVFNGHGKDDTIMGHNNEEIIVAGKNEQLLKSSVVYAISCRSAKKLGPASINAGAVNYTGYDDDFIFLYDPTMLTRPLQDKTAKLFLDPSALFINSLIKGNSVAEAKKKADDAIRKNIVFTLSDKENAPAARLLWWNLKHFVSC